MLTVELLLRAGSTALGVAVALAIAARCGGRRGGIVAGLPTTTLATLLWLATEHGTPFAAAAANGAVGACAVYALFAWAYARAAARFGAPWALLTGCLAATPGWLAVWWASLPLVALAIGATTLCLVLRRTLPSGQPAAAARAARRWESALAAAAAGGISAGVCAAAGWLSPQLCGLLAALPLVGTAAAICQQRQGGAPAVSRFMDGYLTGLIGKAVFCAGFALLVEPLGWPGALAAASACGWAAALWSDRGARRAA